MANGTERAEIPSGGGGDIRGHSDGAFGGGSELHFATLRQPTGACRARFGSCSDSIGRNLCLAERVTPAAIGPVVDKSPGPATP